MPARRRRCGPSAGLLDQAEPARVDRALAVPGSSAEVLLETSDVVERPRRGTVDPARRARHRATSSTTSGRTPAGSRRRPAASPASPARPRRRRRRPATALAAEPPDVAVGVLGEPVGRRPVAVLGADPGGGRRRRRRPGRCSTVTVSGCPPRRRRRRRSRCVPGGERRATGCRRWRRSRRGRATGSGSPARRRRTAGSRPRRAAPAEPTAQPDGERASYPLAPSWRHDPSAGGRVRRRPGPLLASGGQPVAFRSRRELYPVEGRRHRCRRPDRLQPAVPPRERLAARRPPDRAAAAGDHAGPEGARGRRHGAGRLRVPEPRRRRDRRRRRDDLRRRQPGAARRCPPARPGHGARRPALGQRRDLHRAGQGAQQGRRRRRPDRRDRQPGQHQRADRDDQRARHPAASGSRR